MAGPFIIFTFTQLFAVKLHFDTWTSDQWSLKQGVHALSHSC